MMTIVPAGEGGTARDPRVFGQGGECIPMRVLNLSIRRPAFLVLPFLGAVLAAGSLHLLSALAWLPLAIFLSQEVRAQDAGNTPGGGRIDVLHTLDSLLAEEDTDHDLRLSVHDSA